MISLIRRNRIECRLDIPLQVGQAAVGGANSSLGLTPSAQLGFTKPCWAEGGLDIALTAPSVPTPPDLLSVGQGGWSYKVRASGKWRRRVLNPLRQLSRLARVPHDLSSVPTGPLYSLISSYRPSSSRRKSSSARMYLASDMPTSRTEGFFPPLLSRSEISAAVIGFPSVRRRLATWAGRPPVRGPRCLLTRGTFPLRVATAPLYRRHCSRWKSAFRCSSSISFVSSIMEAVVANLKHNCKHFIWRYFLLQNATYRFRLIFAHRMVGFQPGWKSLRKGLTGE